MPRIRFKPLPNHLPGWGWEHTKLPAVDAKARPPTKLERRLAWRENREAPQEARINRAALPDTTKFLILENPDHVSEWKRKHGRWECVSTSEPYLWFKKVRHLDLIRQHLRDQRITFSWSDRRPVLA